MAQGGKDYKKRLATFENADRLLDLALSGKLTQLMNRGSPEELIFA